MQVQSRLKSQPAIRNLQISSTYRFTEPTIINSTSISNFERHSKSGNTPAYKFSEPTFISADKPGDLANTVTSKSCVDFKIELEPIVDMSYNTDIGTIGTTESVGSNASRLPGVFEAKQKQGRRVYQNCFVSNEASPIKKVCISLISGFE